MAANRRLLALFCACAVLLAIASPHTCLAKDAGEEPRATETVMIYGILDVPPMFFTERNPHEAEKKGEIYITTGTSSQAIHAPVQQDGTFVLRNVPYGAYLLHAELGHFMFPTVRVDVQRKGSMPVVRGYANDARLTPLDGTATEMDDPLRIAPISVHQYYVPRDQYSIMMILKNPMILLMIVSFGLMGMMQLMPEQDRKEGLKEYKKMRGNLFSSISPGGAGEADESNGQKTVTNKKKQ